MASSLFRRHGLTRRILPAVVGFVAAKILLHASGYQPLELNTLVSSMIAANVFLLGFLIGGAMPDFKEAERLPGEMAASLDAIGDEFTGLVERKSLAEAKEGLGRLASVADGIHDWFHRRTNSRDLMTRISGLGATFAALEPHMTANFIVRLKQEQTALRKLVTRAHSIRETTFAPTAYAIAELFTGLMLVTLLLVDFGGRFASGWFAALAGFLLIYMIFLIHDLDNPFNYGPDEHGDDEVPLKPLEAVRAKFSRP